MANSSTIGDRFEKATRELFVQIFPQLGFDVIKPETRISGSQSGYDVRFETRSLGTRDLKVNFFIECKGASKIGRLTTSEFSGKPEQLHKSSFNADYWILISPLRYKNNDFQDLLEIWKKTYPFAFIDWVREGKDENKANLYLDLYKHFPETYEIFKEDVPEDIRDTPPEIALEEIITKLRKDINNAYDEFQSRVVFKGVIPGVRRITPQAIYKTKEVNLTKLNKIRTDYYMLNSSKTYVWKTVCNEMDVQNQKFQTDIRVSIENNDKSINTVWVLGASGCGKTTQMYRTAIDSANSDYPVILINSQELNPTIIFDEYEKYFRLIYHLHNVSLEKDKTKPLLVFIDNPAARIEDISRLLSRIDDLDVDKFNCTFILFEREIRYQEAEKDNFLIDISKSSDQRIYIDSENTTFKKNVLDSFSQALDLPLEDFDIAEEAFFENEHTTVAESIINFCKKTNNKEYKEMAMDWKDFKDTARRQGWNSLTDLYTWTSLLYQFGVSFPVSLLHKTLDNFSQNDFFDFQDFIYDEENSNLPLVLEGDTLRNRHELIAEWHVEEELKPSQLQRLSKILKSVDVQNTLERSIFIALFGRKNIVRWYMAEFLPKDFETILQNAAGNPVTQKMSMMAQGWIYSFKNKPTQALDVFKSILEIDTYFLPAIMETAKAEFLLGKDLEAEQRLQDLLYKRSNDLHTRTELARFYRSQKKFEKAEKLLKECINISSRDLNSRTELAKLYQLQEKHEKAIKTLNELLVIDSQNIQARTELGAIFRFQKKYIDAQRVLKECIKISSDDLNSRTELAKVYQELERYNEAKTILKKCIDISPRDLNSRTELGKVYQELGEYDKAEEILLDLLKLDPQNLQARTELGKVYQELGEYDKAEEILLDLLKLDPQNLQARTELGKVYRELGRFEEAEEILLDLLKLDPQNLQARTELGKVYQELGEYDKAEEILLQSLEIDNKQLHPRTELGKVYQELGRFEEAETRLLEYLELDPNGLQPRTELARVYLNTGLFRKARSVAVSFLQNKSQDDKREIAHLYLTYLNACYLMRRFREGVIFIDRQNSKLLSPQLAEEYGRLLRNYDLQSAVKFFQTASKRFSRSSRLLSEAAICLKLGGNPEAESILEKAIHLDPKKEEKYRDLYKRARNFYPTVFNYIDCKGIILSIDGTKMSGFVNDKSEKYSFRWNNRFNLLYSKLKVGEEVYFDVTNRNYAMNIEPLF